MRRMIVPAILLVLFAVMHVVSIEKLTEERSVLHRGEHQDQLFVMPAPILRIAALDYDGILSDFLFIKGMAYLGGALQSNGNVVRLQLTEPQWRGFYDLMVVSSAMDPYFQDPYYIVNAFLTWDAGLVREANTLLEKGSKARDWDWTMPFFIGFNHFYFLQDYDKAAEYLMEASRRPGASPTLGSLASKLSFKAKKTESSILFLEEMIRKTDDESMKKLFEMRVEAFKSILALEKAVEDYRQRFGRTPVNIDELVRKKIIAEIPIDPYGGKFYLDPTGSVKSTTESELMPHRKNK